MALVMNILPILLSVALVHSNQSMLRPISFKISENVTYDCIDIYKQPGLNHPFLKNHTIQMKPSVLRHELRNNIGNNETNKNKIGCPYGTVPILRNFNEYNTKAQLFEEKYFHPLSADSHGIHFLGVRSRIDEDPYRGVEASFNGYKLNIGKDQAVYSRIYLGSKLNNEVNFIQAGFMINQGFFPDGRVWSYGYWKGKDGQGCFNTACPGFVQVSNTVPIVEPFDLQPGIPAWLHYSIHQDEQTGNWWITLLSKPNVDIGYWPKELFNILDSGAYTVGAGALVQVSRSGSNPPMGNGKFPIGDRKESAIFTNIEVLDSSYKHKIIDSFPIEKLVDDPKCYGLRIGKIKPFHQSQLGFFFNYGGPGGNSCGI